MVHHFPKNSDLDPQRSSEGAGPVALRIRMILTRDEMSHAADKQTKLSHVSRESRNETKSMSSLKKIMTRTLSSQMLMTEFFCSLTSANYSSRNL